MASANIDASLLTVFLTSSGYIALCSNQLDDADEARLFGSNGRLPPQSLSTLVADMLNGTSSAPHRTDKQDLESLERELHESLALVHSALKRFES